MTTFALIYNRQDLTAIAAEVSNPGLTAQEKNTANRYWNGGLNNWANAPYAGNQYACVNTPSQPGNTAPGTVITQNPDGSWKICDPDIRAVVLSGQQISKQGLVDFLRLIGNKYPGALYMLAIADDIVNTGVEPWV